MNYLDDNSLTQVRLDDDPLVKSERPTVRIEFRGGEALVVSDLEADALLRGLIRWKLLQDGGGGGAIAQAVQGAHSWARKMKAGSKVP